MGVKTKQRVQLGAPDAYTVDAPATADRTEPLVDVGTDEEQVLLRLGNLATTGDFGYDGSREWAELFPTIPTLIGALHLLPEVLRGKDPEERERLAELFDAKFEEQFSDHDGNLISRVLESNAGMTVSYAQVREARRLRLEADALRARNEQLVASDGIAVRATEAWERNFSEARRLEQQRLEILHRLHYTELAPTAKKTRKAVVAFEERSAVLRTNLLSLIEGDGRYSGLRAAALGWLTAFEELKREVKAPNPKRKQEQPAEDTQEEVYDDDL